MSGSSLTYKPNNFALPTKASTVESKLLVAPAQVPSQTRPWTPVGSALTSASELTSARLKPSAPGKYCPDELKLPLAVKWRPVTGHGDAVGVAEGVADGVAGAVADAVGVDEGSPVGVSVAVGVDVGDGDVVAVSVGVGVGWR